jgi:heme/copper-type cytochrome/quinol oxidase subunit 1
MPEVKQNISELSIPTGASARFVRGWLLLSIASLVIAGVYSVILILARTPYVQDIFPFVDFFHAALIVHVDLSVLIWFLSFSGVFYTIISVPRFFALDWIALGLACTGTLVIAISPFVEEGNTLMNNYIPILDSRTFLWGLLIYAVGFAFLHVRTLLDTFALKKQDSGEGIFKYGIFTAAVIGFIAVLSFAWSYAGIPETINGAAFYEYLFWGGGHILQFVHTQLMLVSWLWLAGLIGASIKGKKIIIAAFSINLLSALAAPLIYLMYDVVSAEHITSFTALMKYGMGAPPLIIGLIVISAIAGVIISGKIPESAAHLKAAIISSIFLFGAGGVIGFLIHGINVTIPSHYHGVIVGVTLAYMGIIYYFMPKLDMGSPSIKLAKIQLYTYGTGQFLHIIGLAWAGGYGIQRKTAGAAQGLTSIKQIASMGLMGIGGLIAVIGGFMFLVAVINAIMQRKRR